MAERKAVNKYYPPDWDPSKGSINKHVGQHPLRERARKLSQGILIIRFEMPYNIWCGGCGNHIGMGVRYNAEKKKVGNYYTTPIYRFRMKCHLCDNYMEIETDPKNCDYTIVSGARRKEERWDPSATENVQATDHAEKQKLIDDAMYKLEHGEKDKRKSKAAIPGLVQIKDIQSQWKDDFALNQMLRKKFRQEKKIILDKEGKDQQIKDKGSLDLELVNEDPEDVKLAQRIRFHSTGFQEDQRKRRLQIKARPMFRNKVTSAANTQRSSLLEKRQRMAIAKPSVGGVTSPFFRDSDTLGIKRKENKMTSVKIKHENERTEMYASSDKLVFTNEIIDTSQNSEGICHEGPSSETLRCGKSVDSCIRTVSGHDNVFLTRTEPQAVKSEMAIENPLSEPTTDSRNVFRKNGAEKKGTKRKISLISEMYSDTDSDSSK